MTANGSALLRYAMTIYLKIDTGDKWNTAGFLRIQKDYWQDHWNKMGLIKKDFLISTMTSCEMSLLLISRF